VTDAANRPIDCDHPGFPQLLVVIGHRHVLIAQALLPEYAEFRGLGDGDLIALADSFARENCVRREPLVELLSRDLA
jgi:hypothetical protein